uniref:Elongation of fatty acids protein n=2 Tax=Chrysotila carterae TaxID=13221 RepID=A0A7S4C404_CHRCT
MIVWSWLPSAASLQHIGLLCNAGVHTLMYYYYYRRVLGLDCWWKRYVTKIQIVQFCISLGCCAVTLCYLFLGAECAGKRVMLGNVLFNVTLLYQFVGVLATNERGALTREVKRL